jgi:ribulose-phosphate 3-epimerase
MEIIPTTNPQIDFFVFEQRLAQIKDLSAWIQIDVTDGILVKPPSFPLELLGRSDLNLEKNLFDIHLMVKEPLNWLKKCLFVQASRVIGQVEMMSDREKFVTEAKNNGLEVGLAFDLETPLDVNIPQETDLILLMGRHMGFEPRPLDDKIFDRIKFFKDKGYKVALDGGVDTDNFLEIKNSGIDIIYSGQYFLNLTNEKTL